MKIQELNKLTNLTRLLKEMITGFHKFMIAFGHSKNIHRIISTIKNY